MFTPKTTREDIARYLRNWFLENSESCELWEEEGLEFRYIDTHDVDMQILADYIIMKVYENELPGLLENASK